MNRSIFEYNEMTALYKA